MRGKFELGLVIDRHSSLSLQHQLRLRLIDAMNRGILRPGRKLPSSRELAAQVGVARNTVTLAYDALIAEGHLVTRPRSGIFVASDLRNERVTTGRRGLARKTSPSAMLARTIVDHNEFPRPPNWEQHPYPFLDGCVDETLAPVDEWREALKLAFSRQALTRWSGGAAGHDDPMFIDELRTHVLPSWGVTAGPDEIVAAVSARHALYLAAEVLIQRNTPVLLDHGVDHELRRLLRDRQINLLPLSRDQAFTDAASQAPPGSVLMVTSHPAAADKAAGERAQALLRLAAERDAVIIEYAPAPDLRDDAHRLVSLRALDDAGRVVFVSGLSCVVSSGTPPGFICADPRLTERVRQLRRMMGTDLAASMQRAWSYFIGLGHYAACMTRANRVLQARRTALRDALNHYLHFLSKHVSIEPAAGGSAYSVRLPDGVNAFELARTASSRGVLIEPVVADDQPAIVRMGVTSVTKDRIRAGVEQLARVLRGDYKLNSHLLRDEPSPPLDAKALRRALSGATLLYNTVYGDPCTIEVRPDGVLIGRAGFANEDCDVGRWWIENDRWYRQWEHWSYGEIVGFITTVDGDQVRWFNAEGVLRDTALIVRGARRKRSG